MDCSGSLHRAHDAYELRQDLVACRIDDATAMVLDHGENGGMKLLQRSDGRDFILADQAAIAGNVGRENGGQAPIHRHTIL